MFLLLSLSFLPAVLVHCSDESVKLFITAPRELEAVVGSCLIIPCSFRPCPAAGQTFDINRRIFAVWIKDGSHFKDHPERIVFNSSNAVNYPDISLIGNLTERNCTSKFDGLKKPFRTTKFFFRIENESFKATDTSNPVNITLKASPRKPRIQVSGERKEKKSVTITCSAATPCPHSPPQLSWSLRPNAHSQTKRHSDGTFSTEIQENITLSDQHDGLKISCYAVYPAAGGEPEKTPEGTFTLSVSYAPKDTRVSISPSGDLVTLTCSSRAKPAVRSFTWFRTSDRGPIRVSKGDVSTFNVTDRTDAEGFYCVAKNALGNQTSPRILGNEGNLVPVIVPVSISILFICLVVSVWCFKKRRAPPQTQTRSAEDFSGHVPADEAGRDGGGEEELHYQSVSFNQRRTEAQSVSVQDATQSEETLYAQVKVREPEKSSAPAAGVSEDLYAQVQRK